VFARLFIFAQINSTLHSLSLVDPCETTGLQFLMVVGSSLLGVEMMSRIFPPSSATT